MNETAAETGTGVLLGFSTGELLLAGFALLVGVAGRFVFAFWGRKAVEWLTSKTEGDFDDKVGEAVTAPLTLLPVALGVFFAAQALNLSGMAGGVAESLAQTLFAVTVFWAMLNLIEPVFGAMKPLREALSPSMMEWLHRSCRVLLWLIGGATILELWGIRVLPIIAGLGLFGVAVALGAQDLFKNLISGLLILSEKRFAKGHWVKVDGVVEGTVEEIGFRSTKIRQFDRAPVYVPNTALADAAVVNFGEMTNRRISWTIGLEYRTGAEALRAIRDRVEAVIENDERFLPADEAPRLVRLDAFADSSINLMIYCFTKTRDWAEWLSIKEELLLKVKEIVEEEGAGFAFPSSSIYLEPSAGLEALPGMPAEKAGSEPKPAPKAGAKAAAKSSSKPPAKKAAKEKSAKNEPDDGDADDDAPKANGAAPNDPAFAAA